MDVVVDALVSEGMVVVVIVLHSFGKVRNFIDIREEASFRECDTHRIASIGIYSIIEVSFDKCSFLHRS
jgi:F420-dependent methylenetetrahydromethanopterin dehydrogenase